MGQSKSLSLNCWVRIYSKVLRKCNSIPLLLRCSRTVYSFGGLFICSKHSLTASLTEVITDLVQNEKRKAWDCLSNSSSQKCLIYKGRKKQLGPGLAASTCFPCHPLQNPQFVILRAICIQKRKPEWLESFCTLTTGLCWGITQVAPVPPFFPLIESFFIASPASGLDWK